MPRERSRLTRREFARTAAFAATLGSLAPITPLEAEQTISAGGSSPLPQRFPQLDPRSQVEADARFEAILREYPDRFSDEEKKDLRRLCFVNQQSLGKLRTYANNNAKSPAHYLKPIVEHETH